MPAKIVIVPVLERTIEDPDLALHLITLSRWLIDEGKTPQVSGLLLSMASAIIDPHGTKDMVKDLPPEVRETLREQVLALLGGK